MPFASARRVALRFEWDSFKAITNLAKHGVDFNEAREVFEDPLARTIPDVTHASDEPRLGTIGLSRAGRLLVVIHTDRGDRIRIIGARRASQRERHDYEENPT
jgi:uncharacterized DUF497 family protein